MQKRGFTLAEVLITLSIIGLVASLTIPAVTKSYEKATYIAGYKKNYATIAEAVGLIRAEHDGTIQGLTGNEETFIPLLTAKLKTIKVCDWDDNRTYCWHADGNWKTLDGAPISSSIGYGLVTNSGAFYQFFAGASCSDTSACGIFNIDINGYKGPNVAGKDIHRIYIFTNRIEPEHRGAGSCGSEGGCCNKNETPEENNGGKNCGYEILTGNYDWEN